MFDGANGWAISSAESITDVAHRDEVEANSLFEILERQIVPLYYDRRGGRYPRGWVSRIKASIGSLGPKVMASRMVKDYVNGLYEPTAIQTDALAGESFARARELAGWKRRVVAAWSEVKVLDVESDEGTGMVDLGVTRSVAVSVELGSLTPDDVAVELLHGPVAGGDELVETKVVHLTLAASGRSGGEGGGGAGDNPGPYRYEGSFTCDQAGRHGYTVRIVPAHAYLVEPVDLGCVAWA
jgi:starch phosphorylase